MQIRKLEVHDAPAFHALRLRALREHPAAFTSSFEEDAQLPVEASARRLDATRNTFWGAFDADGTLRGMVGLEREQRAKNRHKATVVAMHVAGECAGRGAGRALLQALLQEARAQGLELLVLTVTEGDGPARHLYESVGFRSFGIEPRAIKVGAQAYAKNHMFLQLERA